MTSAYLSKPCRSLAECEALRAAGKPARPTYDELRDALADLCEAVHSGGFPHKTVQRAELMVVRAGAKAGGRP